MQRPNILLITSDQHRADTMGCSGHPCVQTPHLDQLACEGVRFTNAYTDCPICIPARTTLITGIQSHIYGMPSFQASYRMDRPRSQFLGSLVTAAGYQTYLAGKTHWHTDPTFRGGFEGVAWLSQWREQQYIRTGQRNHPTGLGYNEIYPALSQLPPELHSTNWITERCLEFLELRETGQPFFLWASYIDPHPPLVIHEPYYSMYDHDNIPDPVIGSWVDGEDCPLPHYLSMHAAKTDDMSQHHLRKARSVYYGMLTNLDHQLGRLFGKLMLDGVWDNTWIIYTSDHGEFLGDHRNAKKSSFCECSANIPLLIKPPSALGMTPGIQSDALVELADLLPTICDAASAAIPEDVTGLSLLPVINGSQRQIRDMLHGQINSSHMLHDGRYKYLYFVEDGKELLFDTIDDPDDLYPISGEFVHEMRRRLLQHLMKERHPHAANGVLLNQRKQRPTLQVARSQNQTGWAASASMNNMYRDIQKYH